MRLSREKLLMRFVYILTFCLLTKCNRVRAAPVDKGRLNGRKASNTLGGSDISNAPPQPTLSVEWVESQSANNSLNGTEGDHVQKNQTGNTNNSTIDTPPIIDLLNSFNHSNVNTSLPREPIASATVHAWVAHSTSSSTPATTTEVTGSPSSNDLNNNLLESQRPVFDQTDLHVNITPNMPVDSSKIASPEPAITNSNNIQDAPTLQVDTVSPTIVSDFVHIINNNNHVSSASTVVSSGRGRDIPLPATNPDYADSSSGTSSTQTSNTSTYMVIAGTGSLFLVGVASLALYERKFGNFSYKASHNSKERDDSYDTAIGSMNSTLVESGGLEEVVVPTMVDQMPPLKSLHDYDGCLYHNQHDPSIYDELHRTSMVESILKPGAVYAPGRIYGTNISNRSRTQSSLVSWSDAFMEDLTGFESESMDRPFSLSSQASDESEDIKHLVHYSDIKHIMLDTEP